MFGLILLRAQKNGLTGAISDKYASQCSTSRSVVRCWGIRFPAARQKAVSQAQTYFAESIVMPRGAPMTENAVELQIRWTTQREPRLIDESTVHGCSKHRASLQNQTCITEGYLVLRSSFKIGRSKQVGIGKRASPSGRVYDGLLGCSPNKLICKNFWFIWACCCAAYLLQASVQG